MQNKVYKDRQSHSCRADKNPYWHDGRVDKDTDGHIGRAHSLSQTETDLYANIFISN